MGEVNTLRKMDTGWIWLVLEKGDVSKRARPLGLIICPNHVARPQQSSLDHMVQADHLAQLFGQAIHLAQPSGATIWPNGLLYYSLAIWPDRPAKTHKLFTGFRVFNLMLGFRFMNFLVFFGCFFGFVFGFLGLVF